jgi:MFS family permease
LAERNARWYLTGQTFSLFGDTALWLAMGIWVKELTGSSGDAGLTFFFFGLGSICSPLAGLVVDRVRRRSLLIWANLAGAAVVLALLAVHGRNQVWLIWLVILVYGIIYAYLSSAQSALLVTMLDDDLLIDANGALRTIREGLRLVGPLAGAGLFALIGGGAVAIVDSATFLIAAAALLFVHVEEGKPQPSEQHWLREVGAGAAHIWRTVVLRQITMAAAFACLVIGFLEPIAFAVVSQGLHRVPTFLGVIIAVQGIGAVAGGLTSAPAARRIGEGPLCGFGLVLLAIGSGLFMVANLVAVFAGALVLGESLPWVIVGFMTLLQRRTPPELQGRVSAAADTLTSIPQTASIAVGATLLGIVDYRLLLAVVAAVVAGAGAYLLTRREQWERPATVPTAPAPAETAKASLAAAAAPAARGAGRSAPGETIETE